MDYRVRDMVHGTVLALFRGCYARPMRTVVTLIMLTFATVALFGGVVLAVFAACAVGVAGFATVIVFAGRIAERQCWSPKER